MRAAGHGLHCAFDCALHPEVGHTPAQRAVHRFADLGISWMWILVQQGLRSDDLSVLTEAALWRLFINPGLLHGMQPAALRKSCERRDFTFDGRNRRDTGKYRRTIDDYLACTALS